MPTTTAVSRRKGTTLLAAALFALGGCGATDPVGPDPLGPGEVDPESVSISAPSTEVEEGATLQLTATVTPFGAPQDVTWSTDDVTTALVSASGLVTPVSLGDVTITATSTADATRSGSIDITVTCRNLTQAMVAGP